jgi:hypothetical protein
MLSPGSKFHEAKSSEMAHFVLKCNKEDYLSPSLHEAFSLKCFLAQLKTQAAFSRNQDSKPEFE